MSQTNIKTNQENPPQQDIYEIHVIGNLIPRWEEWFEGLNAQPMENDGILLSGPIADQSALHGLLMKLRDLNIALISVNKKEHVRPDLNPLNTFERRNNMNNQKSFARVTGIFVGLAVAGISIAVASQVVPSDFAQTVMIAIGSAVFGAGLTFFLVRSSKLIDK